MDKSKKNSKKSKSGRLSKSAEAKRKKVYGLWDRACLFLLLVLTAAFLVCWGRAYELQSAVNHGHALWFLLLTAYPFLGLLGLINVLFGTTGTQFVHYFTSTNPVCGLGAVDLVYLLLIWLLFRWRGIRWFGPGGLKAAANLVLILAFWGVFQLFLTGLMFLWDAGGLTPFHPDDAPAVSAPADPTALPDSSAPVEPAP